MILIDRPYFAAMEHSGEHYHVVDTGLCLSEDTSTGVHIFAESADVSTCIVQSDVELFVNDNCAGKCTGWT